VFNTKEENVMRRVSARMLGIAALLILLDASRGWPEVFVPFHPPVYRIEGFIDRAPKGTKVIDRIQIAARNEPTRTLLVTVYQIPGDAALDRYLSREMMAPYQLMGNRDDVSHLLRAPAGTAVQGTFVVYTQGSPALRVASLDSPRW
jgi:hypothetical protein